MDGTSTSQSTDTQRSVGDEELDHENTMSILIATDNHLGFMAKDPERGRDSLVTFEEILQIAQEKKVDFILLGGDLFHDNKPSRKVLHKTMEMLRKYCLGDRPCYLEFLSDQSINFAANSFPSVNYEDPNYNVSIPVFSIHGNHDDPAGDGNLCTLNLFSVSGLVNYFGKANDVDDITISPILMQKGTTKLALYGLGSVRDERLHRTFLTKNVKMLRPKEDADSWFNIFVLHQNRARHGPKNHIPESFLDDFLDLIIWGHEHECLIEPQYSSDSGKDIFISQPGSSVATSLCEGETKKKHVGILRVAGKNFRMDKFPLKTVRAFHMRQVILSETDLDPADEDAVQEYLAEQVEELIALAGQEHTGDKRQPKRPLIRLKVEYTGGFSPFNVYTFGQQFLQRVANTKDILTFFRRRVPTGGRRGNNGDEDDILPEFENVTMEDLISAFLKSSPKPLRMLSEHKLGLALKEFVEKDENDAIAEMVNLQIDDTRKAISTKNFRDEDIVSEVVKETERSRTEEPTKEEVARTKKVLEEALSQSKGRNEQVTLSDESEEESENQTSTRGRGRGRGRKQRGRGSRTTSKSRDNSSVTSRASTRGKKQQLSFENDYANTLPGNKESRGSSRPDDNLNDEDEEEDPFAFPSKRQRK